MKTHAIETGRLEHWEIRELTSLSGIRTADEAQLRKRELASVAAGLLRAKRDCVRQLEQRGGNGEWAARARRALAHKCEQIRLVSDALNIVTEMERRLPGRATGEISRAFVLAAREILPPHTFAAVQRHALTLAQQAQKS